MKSTVIALSLMAIASGSYGASPARMAPNAAVRSLNATAAGTDQAEVSIYITVDSETVDYEALAKAGARITRSYGNVLTARASASSIAAIASVEGVVYVEASSPAGQMLDVAREEVGMSLIHDGLVGLSSPFTGKGVVVGVVDSGFDYGHAAFRDKDGNLRIKRVWEQGSAASGSLSSPESFGYGVELLTSDDILGAGGDIRNNSHGTHVTSIAAGSDTYLDGALRGMAPDADIVLVSMTDAGLNNVSISDAIAYIFDYAEEAGKPCVVNLSLGSHSGPHDGTSTFDVIADRLQGPGRLIVGSAGNHRADKFHLRREFASADDNPLRTFVDYKTSLSASNTGGDIEIWGEGDFDVAIGCYKYGTGFTTDRFVFTPDSEEGVETVSLGRNLPGDFTVAIETSPLNGKRHLLLTSGIRSIRTGYGVGIEVIPHGESTVDVWADNIRLGLTSKDEEGFSTPSGESTICEIGGTANRILTVGSYTTRSNYTILGQTAGNTLPGETDGQISTFSSCGPTADLRVKPQVCAPGCFISGAVSSYDNSGTLILSAYHWDDERDYSYGYMQGTSMSSPLVAGVVAVWLQVYPYLSPEDLARIVRETSRKDAFTGALSSPSNDWGYGKIDPPGGLEKVIELAKLNGVDEVITDIRDSDDLTVYNLYGVAVSADGSTDNLPAGIYIRGGRKILVK